VRAVNEDTFLDQSDIGLWVVADGMGGHARGDVASRLVVDAFSDMRRPASLDAFALETRHRLQLANQAIQQETQSHAGNQLMGSTVVVLLVYKRQWRCLWAGDSRAYLMREGQLRQISHDHSLAQELLDQGELSPGDPRSQAYANRITRAVGASPKLVLDERGSDLRDGDAILLCSDGLNKELSESEIASVLEGYDCDDASRELIELSLERGGRDNVTVAVVRFEANTGFSAYSSDDTAVNHQLTHPSVIAGTGSVLRGAGAVPRPPAIQELR
jgi:serine/threonine protein phosphatase PrpC